ncbi:hypothetical protein B0H19DRAFT_1172851 [Mycena capillaripes]|nr:hypothetical protein B0H19DRAFT_1172851 [Mycena capillaripes]
MALCPLRWGCLLLCLGLCPQVSLNTTIKLHFGGVRTKETTGYDDTLERDTTGHFCDKHLIVLETLNPTLLQ